MAQIIEIMVACISVWSNKGRRNIIIMVMNSDLTGEVNMSRRVYEVDQVWLLI